MSIEGLLQMLVQLGGVGALIAVVVNVLKTTGVVKDGQAGMVSAGLNLLALAALFGVQVWKPETDLVWLDSQAGALATLLTTVFGYIWQIVAAKMTHKALSGTPVVGKSYTLEALAVAVQQAEMAAAKAYETARAQREC